MNFDAICFLIDVSDISPEIVTTTEITTEIESDFETRSELETPLEVEGQPPKFLKSPEDVETQPGERAELVTKVTGSPLPEVTWYRDGKV